MNTKKYNDIKKQNNEIIFYENDTKLIHRAPKIKNKKILIYNKKYKLISECIVEKNKKNILTVYSNDKIYDSVFEFSNGILKTIKITIENKTFTWNDEFNIKIDQYQYGSLKSVLNALNDEVYSVEDHLYDLI